MHLLSLIFGIGLLPSAFTLKCYECSSPETCIETQTECRQGYQCGARMTAMYAGGKKIQEFHIKSCVLPEECIKSSVNFGNVKYVSTSKCCTSDLCNTQPAPVPKGLTPNGIKCFTCDNITCTHTLNCEEDEDYCISASATMRAEKKIMKGCASKQACLASVKAKGAHEQITCCQGNFCNSASTTVPEGLTLNGKMCFTCDDTTCTHTLGCKGDEDYCISATVAVGTVKKSWKGCASKQACSASVQAKGAQDYITCCQGNFCNSATTPGAGLLLLVAPLVSLVMLS